MNKIKFIVCVLGALLWIFGATVSFSSFAPLGGIFTHSTGLFSLKLPDEGVLKIRTEGNYFPEIHIDETGVPHIFGKNKQELAFGVGYMQARDRYFQMDLIIRSVKGELSEIFGKQTLDEDIWWRPYEFDRKAREILNSTKVDHPEVYDYMMAFGMGVRQYLNDEAIDDRPFEYTVFGTEPIEWQDHYPLLVLWYMSKGLAFEDQHLIRQDQLNKLPKDLLDAFFPSTDKSSPLIIPDSANAVVSKNSYIKTNTNITWPIEDQIREKERKEGVGSNNWVVHGSKTSTGYPILCNDPHLLMTLPSIFYEVHLVLPDQNIYGFTLASSPFLVIGHNNDIAWGITNGHWDLTERTLLNIDKNNPTVYSIEGNWKAFEIAKYNIKVKGQSEHILEYSYSDFGKVIKEPDGNLYAQKWFPEVKHNSFISFIEMLDAKNSTEFVDALVHYEYPPQNFAYQDRSGNIGIVPSGKMPKKEKGYAGGLTGHDSKQNYEFIPYEDWPALKNPERGFLFSANQEPTQNGNYYNYGWMENNYRAKRIFEFLSSKDTFTFEDLQNLQKDSKDLGALELQALLKKTFGPNPDNKILMQLINFDGVVKGASNDPLLFYYFDQGLEIEFRRLLKRYWNLNQKPSFAAIMQYMNNNDPMLLKDTSITVRDFMLKVAEGTDKFLKSGFGENYSEVPFAEVADFDVPHISQIPGMGMEIKSFDGNSNTVSVNSAAHASLRFMVTFEDGNSVKSKVIIAGGQSGRINSPNFKDQMDQWIANDYRSPQHSSDKSTLKDVNTKIYFEKK